MKTVGASIREYQVTCLLKAQDNLGKLRAGGFPLPDDVCTEVQEIMAKIPALIARLEGGVAAPAGSGVLTLRSCRTP